MVIAALKYVLVWEVAGHIGQSLALYMLYLALDCMLIADIVQYIGIVGVYLCSTVIGRHIMLISVVILVQWFHCNHGNSDCWYIVNLVNSVSSGLVYSVVVLSELIAKKAKEMEAKSGSPGAVTDQPHTPTPGSEPPGEGAEGGGEGKEDWLSSWGLGGLTAVVKQTGNVVKQTTGMMQKTVKDTSSVVTEKVSAGTHQNIESHSWTAAPLVVAASQHRRFLVRYFVMTLDIKLSHCKVSK